MSLCAERYPGRQRPRREWPGPPPAGPRPVAGAWVALRTHSTHISQAGPKGRRPGARNGDCPDIRCLPARPWREVCSSAAPESPTLIRRERKPVDTRLEVAMIPVSDVDQAKRFYQGLGWRLDADIPLGDGARIVQLTPPGSACSVSFGSGVSPGMELVVKDIDAARAELAGRGVEVSEAFHREACKLASGPDPDHT